MIKQIIFPSSISLRVVFLLTFGFQTKAMQINELDACPPLASKAFFQMYFITWLMWGELFFPEVVSW